ncbi:hypothetical protein BY996DRAFT_6416790 [Phakopsora pachyrhizi]|nr:hypothetical protein BY996DRAFT_6416790 [Phakopsora pachyrhizi]
MLGIPNGHLPGSDAWNDAFRSNQQSDAIDNLEDPMEYLNQKKKKSKGSDDNQGGEKVGVIGSVVILVENSGIGRWKSGAPVVIADEKDDPSLAKSQEAGIP